MYRKIMVPLDGSDLAECVLPHVEAIAMGCEVNDVAFVRTVEPFQLPRGSEWVPTPEEQQRIESSHRSDAQDYLNQLVGRLKYDGVSLQTEVIMGKAAESLADYAEKNGVDLIVIATHGRSGVSRWVWGSVADRILRSACVPVLMVRAPGCVPGI
jgi:nucleotide-binding universal stress UspA family protein